MEQHRKFSFAFFTIINTRTHAISYHLSHNLFFHHNHSLFPRSYNTQRANLGWSQWTARQNRPAYPWAARGTSVA